MVQSVLFLLLGFFSATLLALIIAPAVWRRAVILTRRRIEASVPLKVDELRAEKDQVRAEAAIEIRKTEMKFKALNEKAIAQKQEISKRLDDIRQLNEENNTQAQTIEGLDANVAALKSELTQMKGDNSKLSSEFANACDQIEQKIADNNELARRLDEASLVSSNRQIDLVASEAKIEKMVGEIDALKRKRDESENHVRDMSADLKVAERTLQLSEKKVASLEKKLEKLLSSLSDSEERLDRREKEIARLKDRLKTQSVSISATDRADPGKFTAKQPNGSMEGNAVSENNNELERKVGKLEQDRTRLEARLKKVVAENRRLKSGAVDAQTAGADDVEQRQNAELRKQINHLAAEIVNLTAMLDGPNSEISRIIRDGKGSASSIDRAASIADRVRALREAALSAHHTRVE